MTANNLPLEPAEDGKGLPSPSLRSRRAMRVPCPLRSCAIPGHRRARLRWCYVPGEISVNGQAVHMQR